MAIEFIGSASGVSSAGLPAHQAGDLLLAFAYRDGSTSAPSAPSGWTTISSASGSNSNSARLAYKFATTDAESSGSWSNATSLIVHLYRGVIEIGAHSFATGSGTLVTYPALPLQADDGSSWVAAFAGHRSTNTALESEPAGLTLRESVVDSTDEACGFDTNGGVSQWGAQQVSVGGTASGWFSRVVELRALQEAQDGSATEVLVLPQAQGQAAEDVAAGSDAWVLVQTSGAGVQASEQAQGGAATSLWVQPAGAGLAQEFVSAGSHAAVAVLATAQGLDTSQHVQGGSTSSLSVQALGQGDAYFVYLSGGAVATVLAQAIAQGQAQEVVIGGASSAVSVTTLGQGSAQDVVLGGSETQIVVRGLAAGRQRERVLQAGLTQAIREAYASAPSDTVVFHTLEIGHPAFSEPIRVVRDRQMLTARLEASAPRQGGQLVNFVGFAFDIVPPEVTHTAVPQCVIELDNVSREIVAHIEQAISSPELITVTYRAYLSDDLTAPENDPPLTLTVLAISANVFRVRATCGFPNLANKRFPGLDYTAEVFPGLISQ